MSEAKENFDLTPIQRQKGGSKTNPRQALQHGQGGHLASDLKNIRLKKLDSDSTVDTPSPAKFVKKPTEMEVAKQSQQNAGIYPTIPQDEVQQNDQQTGDNLDQSQKDITEVRMENMHQHQGQKKQPAKDRQQEATELANHAAEKHAKYYDGTLKSLCGSRPMQTYVSTFNRLKGSQESTEQTVNRWIQALHSVDFGISFLVWRLFFYAKDLSSNVYEKAGRKGNGFAQMMASSSIPTIVLFTVGFTLLSPIIFGSLLFLVPAVCILLAFLLIPAIFVIPTGLFLLFLFDQLPIPGKSMAKNSFGRVNLINRGTKAEGKEGEEIRTTMAYQKTH